MLPYRVELLHVLALLFLAHQQEKVSRLLAIRDTK